MTTKTPEECLIEWEKAAVGLASFAKPIGSAIAGAGKWMASKFKAPAAKAWTPPSYSSSGIPSASAASAAAAKKPFMQRALVPTMVTSMGLNGLDSAYGTYQTARGQIDHSTGRLEGNAEAIAHMMNQFGNMGIWDKTKMLFAGKDAFTSDAGRQSIQEFLSRNKDPEMQKYGPLVFSKALARLRQMQAGGPTTALTPVTGYMAGQQQQMERTTQTLKELLQANPALRGGKPPTAP